LPSSAGSRRCASARRLARLKFQFRPIPAAEDSLSARNTANVFVYSHAIMEALTMETEMDSWNDDRLEELNGRVKEGFAEVDKRFDKVDERFDKVDERFVRVESEMKEGFARIDRRFEKVASREGFAEVKVELNRVNERLDRVMYTLMATGVGLVGTVAVGILGLILKG
jgi:archaellum component FlaC